MVCGLEVTIQLWRFYTQSRYTCRRQSTQSIFLFYSLLYSLKIVSFIEPETLFLLNWLSSFQSPLSLLPSTGLKGIYGHVKFLQECQRFELTSSKLHSSCSYCPSHFPSSQYGFNTFLDTWPVAIASHSIECTITLFIAPIDSYASQFQPILIYLFFKSILTYLLLLLSLVPCC